MNNLETTSENVRNSVVSLRNKSTDQQNLLGPHDHSDQQEIEYREDPYRWFILIFYLLASSNVGFLIVTTAPIATQMRKSASVINFFTSSFMILSFAFTFPASWLISEKSIKISIWIGIITTVIGAWMRVFINYNFWLSFSGQWVAAISSSFFFNAPSHLAARWFAPKSRAIATTIMVLTLPVFSAVGGYIPVVFVDNELKEDIIPQDTINHYRGRVYDLFFYEAIWCSATGALCFFMFREQPRYLVSPTSMMKRYSFWSSFGKILKKPSFVMIALATGFQIGCFNTFQTVMQQIFENYGVTSQNVGIYNILNSPISPISALIFGFWAGRIKRFKIFLIILYFANFVVNTVLIPLIQFKNQNAYIVGTIQLLSCGLIAPGPALSMELAAEITFPTAEAFTAGLIVVVDKLLSFILTTIAGPIQEDTYAILWMISGCLLFSCICTIFIKESFLRSKADNYIEGTPSSKGENDVTPT